MDVAPLGPLGRNRHDSSSSTLTGTPRQLSLNRARQEGGLWFSVATTSRQMAMLFLGGVVLEFFGQLTQHKNVTPGQDRCACIFFAMGTGNALGFFLGNLLLLAMMMPWRGWPGCVYAIRSGLVVSTGAFASGAVWQPLVDLWHGASLPFELAMPLTGLACGASFYLGITAAAMASAALSSCADTAETQRRHARPVGDPMVARGEPPHTPGAELPSLPEEPEDAGCCCFLCWRPVSDCIKDLTLAVAVGGADAALVGTDRAWHGNWLQPVVGERDGVSAPMDCLRAGFACMLGFVALQAALVPLVPVRWMWTTPDAPDRRTTLNEAGVVILRPPTRSLAPTWSSSKTYLATAGGAGGSAFGGGGVFDRASFNGVIGGPGAARPPSPQRPLGAPLLGDVFADLEPAEEGRGAAVPAAAANGGGGAGGAA